MRLLKLHLSVVNFVLSRFISPFEIKYEYTRSVKWQTGVENISELIYIV